MNVPTHFVDLDRLTRSFRHNNMFLQGFLVTLTLNANLKKYLTLYKSIGYSCILFDLSDKYLYREVGNSASLRLNRYKKGQCLTRFTQTGAWSEGLSSFRVALSMPTSVQFDAKSVLTRI
jgi:hypothetical protein